MMVMERPTLRERMRRARLRQHRQRVRAAVAAFRVAITLCSVMLLVLMARAID